MLHLLHCLTVYAFSKIHILVPGIFMIVIRLTNIFAVPLLLLKQAELFLKL